MFPDSKEGGNTYDTVRYEIQKTWKIQLLQPPIYMMKQ